MRGDADTAVPQAHAHVLREEVLDGGRVVAGGEGEGQDARSLRGRVPVDLGAEPARGPHDPVVEAEDARLDPRELEVVDLAEPLGEATDAGGVLRAGLEPPRIREVIEGV